MKVLTAAAVVAVLIGAAVYGVWSNAKTPATTDTATATVAAPAANQRAEAQDGADAAAADSSTDAGTFHGYACTVDCSGHEAGYQWAEENGITDPDDCPIDPHNSHSFTEGCWAFAGREGDG